MTGAGLIKFENASKRSRKSRSNKIVGPIPAQLMVFDCKSKETEWF